MARKKTTPSPAPEQTPPEQPPNEAAPSTAPELAPNVAASKPEEASPVAPADQQPAAAEVSEKPAPAESAPEEPKTTSEQPEPTLEELSPGDQTTQVDDADTDKAVDDIAAHEADTMLAVQDALGRKHSQPEPSGWKAKLKRLLKSRRTWSVIVILILLALALPVTRYKLLGLVIKKQVNVVVIDSKTNTPVSEAKVNLHGVSAATNADGKATLKVPPGSTTLTVSKQYYKSYRAKTFVGLKAATKPKVKLVATGRQVPITVVNIFTGRPLANARITALKTTVKTNARGQATIVLPAAANTDSATISCKNYNTAKITIQVTNSVLPANSFKLVPAGHLYFLSNVSGTIDVVKSNLDGSDRQTVLAGTGKEDPTTTSLLATRDWRYLVLKSSRDGSRPALYLIDTSDDKVTEFDGNNGTFNLIGWSGHNFMYDFVSATVPQSQTGHEVIKSYDADNQQPNQLDQTQAEATSGGYIAQEFYNFYVLNNLLVYNTQWYSGGGDVGNKQATIRAVQPDGQNKKDYQSYPAAGLNYVLAAHYQPQAVYYEADSSATNSATYYNFANQAVNTVSIDHSTLLRSYPTYLLSPSGKQTLWSAQQNGQTELFVGDDASQHGTVLTGLDGYQPYGWFSDDYLLVSKDDTDLYLVPADGLKTGQQPFKIGYYYKPVPQLNNYGYGYGGL
ncbi:MAG TPA: carboxypeptidase regulatory-like domain-containing protein [Candidatus Saccharimonadales bacterium]|nr:carboxypeptidase regulatory-like domain-containing protein [Candidatus Saccharimonadales bacterium]